MPQCWSTVAPDPVTGRHPRPANPNRRTSASWGWSASHNISSVGGCDSGMGPIRARAIPAPAGRTPTSPRDAVHDAVLPQRSLVHDARFSRTRAEAALRVSASAWTRFRSRVSYPPLQQVARGLRGIAVAPRRLRGRSRATRCGTSGLGPREPAPAQERSRRCPGPSPGAPRCLPPRPAATRRGSAGHAPGRSTAESPSSPGRRRCCAGRTGPRRLRR